MTDLVKRLRAAILVRKRLAEAAEKAAPGPWVNVGQDGLGDAWQIHGAPTGEMTVGHPDGGGKPVLVPELSRVATLLYEDGGGVWAREAADHMVANQPSVVIRRCDADLKLLDAHLGYYGPGADESFPVPALSILAEAYGVAEDRQGEAR